MRNLIPFFVILFLYSCNTAVKDTKTLKQGMYRAVLEVDDNVELPFVFEVYKTNKLKIFNAEEVILAEDIEFKNDSIYLKTPVFEGYIAAAIKGDKLEGYFVKESLDRIVPFKAKYNTSERFGTSKKPKADVTGIWETVFSQGDEENQYVAKGVFKQEGAKVTGTFRTTTGDYRYLEGVVNGNKMQLSTFDGAHAFLFTATVTDSTLNGVFYSGNHWKEPFVAKRNSNFELPDAETLTYLKEGYDHLDFNFPDENGNNISLKDQRFKDKVVIVQIMGTWCPNCLDESIYYAEYYKNRNSKDVEFVALAFEYARTKEKAFDKIKLLKQKLGITYPVVLAQYGSSNKKKAQEKLPMLNHVLSYPTTIFIDKKNKVRKIHTGFNGPATGAKYLEFKTDFESYVVQLLAE